MKPYTILIKQISAKLQAWNDAARDQLPPKGWIHTLRTTLGMTTAQLAKRLGVNQSRVVQLEQGEITGSVTLESLHKAAAAMDCKFIYAIVPNDSLEKILENRARFVAKKQLGKTYRNLLLDTQAMNELDLKEQLAELIKELLENNPKKLWKE